MKTSRWNDIYNYFLSYKRYILEHRKKCAFYEQENNYIFYLLVYVIVDKRENYLNTKRLHYLSEGT